MSHRRRALSALLALAASTVAVSVTSVEQAAATYSFSASVATGGTIGTMWVDALYDGAGGGGAYDTGYSWRSDGSLWNMNMSTYQETTRATSLTVPGAPTMVRLELYPKPTSDFNLPYDMWSGNVGGAHVQREAAKDGSGWLNFGQIPLPTLGQLDAFRIEGGIVSSTPVPDGRVEFDVFHIDCSYPQTCPATKRSSTGAHVGAFATGESKNGRWSGGIGWPGFYIVFIRDTSTGRNVHGFMNISPNAVPTLDLDAICFGLDTCVYDQGAPAVPTGGFHPTSPVRVLDTRTMTGIRNGPIRPGDGRHSSPNPITRQDETANHDLKVTGVAGIPETGVSAVLLNVTAVNAPSLGYLTVYPRPSSVGDVFNDQATYRTPATSNLNLYPWETTANLVLARVGAGGKIRFNSAAFGSMHVVADVAGWFDTGAASTASGGLGFTSVTPTRLLDTRNGIGDASGRFRPGDDRALKVVGVAGVPQGARSVVVSITAGAPSGPGYVTAYPSGQAKPNASNLNVSPGQTRANLAVVEVGTDGSIHLAVAETDMDLMVDVFGYYGPGGGRTTTIDPVRVVDSRNGLGTPARPMGPGETRQVQIAGVGGVPSNASAVVLNVTAADTNSWSWMTVWPSNVSRPTVSNLNWTGGRIVPNMVIVGLSPTGTLSVYNDLGNVNLIVDVFGYTT